MDGFGSHTFSLINAQGNRLWCKFHFKTLQGHQTSTEEESTQIKGEDPDHATHDLFEAIAQGANTTFEDAYELGECFSHSANLQEALISYEQHRIERTKIIQARSALGEMRYYDDTSTSPGQAEQRQMPLNEDFSKWLYN